jgi:hypothetical protein
MTDREHENDVEGNRTAERGSALLPFSPVDPLMTGTPVVTEDGDVLGVVSEDGPDRFKVAAPLAEDYWLPKDAIAGVAPGGDLVLAVDMDGLDAVKVDAPDDD